MASLDWCSTCGEHVDDCNCPRPYSDADPDPNRDDD